MKRYGTITLIAGLLGCSLGLAACGERSGEANVATSEAGSTVSEDVSALPAVDETAARAFIREEGSTLEVLTFERVGSVTKEGVVKGYVAPVYAVPVAAGQSLKVVFQPSNSNLYFNVSDVTDQSGAAVFRGEVDGETAELKALKDTTYVITPYQPRAMARRASEGSYSLTVSRN